MASCDVEKVEQSIIEVPGEERTTHINSKLENSVLQRLDCVVLPIVGMYYLLSIMDRSSLGNARVAGLQQDPKLTDWQYQTGMFI
jgi:hypothetical protein